MHPKATCQTGSQCFGDRRCSRATGWLTACVLLFLHAASGANGQLAVTEVMSSAATNCGGVNVARGPDFWELTNFGDEAVDLTGYSFWDGDAVVFSPEIQLPGPPIPIQPQESIIFVRSGNSRITNAASFRQWWWGNTRPCQRFRFTFTGGRGLTILVTRFGCGIRRQTWLPKCALAKRR